MIQSEKERDEVLGFRDCEICDKAYRLEIEDLVRGEPRIFCPECLQKLRKMLLEDVP